MAITRRKGNRRNTGIGFVIASLLVWFFASFWAEISQVWQWLRQTLDHQAAVVLPSEGVILSRQVLLFNLLVGFLLLFLLWMLLAAASTLLPVRNFSETYRAAWHLLFYMLGLIGPAIFVKDGVEYSTAEEKRRPGPGVLVVDYQSAVVLEQQIAPPGLGHLIARMLQTLMILLNVIDPFEPMDNERSVIRRYLVSIGLAGPFKPTRVRGAGIVFTRPRERIRGVTSLRKQSRLRNNVAAYTRDGIELTTAVWCSFTVGQVPAVFQVTYHGSRRFENMRLVSTQDVVEEKDGKTLKKIKVRYINDDELDLADRMEIHEAARKLEYEGYTSQPPVEPYQVFGTIREEARQALLVERVALWRARAAELRSSVMTSLVSLLGLVMAALGARRAAVSLESAASVERANAAGREAVAAESENSACTPAAENGYAMMDVVNTRIQTGEASLFERFANAVSHTTIEFSDFIADLLIASTGSLTLAALFLFAFLSIGATPVAIFSALNALQGSLGALLLAIVSALVVVATLKTIVLTLAATYLQEAVGRDNQRIASYLMHNIAPQEMSRKAATSKSAENLTEIVQRVVQRKAVEETLTEADREANQLATAVHNTVEWAGLINVEAKAASHSGWQRVLEARRAPEGTLRKIPVRAEMMQIIAARLADRLKNHAARIGRSLQVLISSAYQWAEKITIWLGVFLARTNADTLMAAANLSNRIAGWRISVLLAVDISARRAAAVYRAASAIERAKAAERRAAAARRIARQQRGRSEYALVTLARQARRIVDEKASAAQRVSAWLITDLLNGDHHTTTLRQQADRATALRAEKAAALNEITAEERIFAERIFKAAASTARGKQNEEAPWTDLPVQVAVDLYREMISKINYDNLYQPDERGEFPLPRHISQFNTSVRNMGTLSYRLVVQRDGSGLLHDQSYDPSELRCSPICRLENTRGKVLRERGIKVLASGFLDLIPPDEVYKQRLESWRADWEKDTKIARATSDLAATRVRARARAQAQQAMIYSLSHIFKTSKGSREALALRVLQALESAAVDPKTSQLLPKDTVELLRNLHTWLLPGDLHARQPRKSDFDIEVTNKNPPELEP